MLHKEEFNNLIHIFQKELNDRLGEARENLLYKNVEMMTSIEFSMALCETLTMYNRDQLPSVKHITSIAYRIAPEAEKQQLKLKLKLANR